jgi:plastocyanin
MRALPTVPAARRIVAAGPRSIRLPVVAAGVALLAACGGGDDELPAVDGATSPRFEVHATEMAYDPDAVAVEAGEVEVVLYNDGDLYHDLRIEDQPFIAEAGSGQKATQHVTLEEGSYRFFCSISGHREAGMEGVLEVR